MSALKSFQPGVLSVLRIVTAYLFLLHGTAKFFSFPMSMGGAPEGLMLVAGILEIVGGILFCFVFLYLAVAGGGAWALDNVYGKDKD